MSDVRLSGLAVLSVEQERAQKHDLRDVGLIKEHLLPIGLKQENNFTCYLNDVRCV